MASDKGYLEYVLEQLSDLPDITFKKMMGEYILYYKDRIFGGIYDNRLLVKAVSSAENLMPDARRELPYEGAKEMLLVEEIDDRSFMAELVETMYPELPEVKKRKKQQI